MHLDELVRRRSEEEGSSASEIIGETNSDLEGLAKFAKTKEQLEEVVKKMGQLPEQAMGLFDVQQDPSQRVNPLTSTAEVNAMAMPILKEYIGKVQDPQSNLVDASPHVHESLERR